MKCDEFRATSPRWLVRQRHQGRGALDPLDDANALAQDRGDVLQVVHLEFDDDVVGSHHLVHLDDAGDAAERVRHVPGPARVGDDEDIGLDGHGAPPAGSPCGLRDWIWQHYTTEEAPRRLIWRMRAATC